jgi:hypothetical protein
MPGLTEKRCRNHRLREAVARCPECGRYFCRECVTEHERRLLCTDCLQKWQAAAKSGARRASTVLTLGHFMAGSLLAWAVFFYLGRILFSLPAEFHEGSIWQSGWQWIK